MRRAGLVVLLLAGVTACGPVAAATPSSDAPTLLSQSLLRLSQDAAVHVSGDIVPPSSASGAIDAVVTGSGATGQVGEGQASRAFTLTGGHLYLAGPGGSWIDSSEAGSPAATTALCAAQSTDRLARVISGAASATAGYSDTTRVSGRSAIVVTSGRIQVTVATDGTADLLRAVATAQGRELSFDLTFSPASGSVALTPVAGAQPGPPASGGVPLAELDNYC